MIAAATDEPSVRKVHRDDASIAETQGLPASVEVKESSDSDDGRLRECRRYRTGSPPHSDKTPSVHFSRHYFMLDGREYWTRSPLGRRPHPKAKSTADVKVEKLQHGGDLIIPGATPLSVRSMESDFAMMAGIVVDRVTRPPSDGGMGPEVLYSAENPSHSGVPQASQNSVTIGIPTSSYPITTFITVGSTFHRNPTVHLHLACTST